MELFEIYYEVSREEIQQAVLHNTFDDILPLLKIKIQQDNKIEKEKAKIKSNNG